MKISKKKIKNMKYLLISTIITFSNFNIFSQTVSKNLPKGQVITSVRNGKKDVNVWSLSDNVLKFNDKSYSFVKDEKLSGLTKICGWVLIADKQYRIVLFIEITEIEITNSKGERINSFN